MAKGYGDKLARGAASATYPAGVKGISETTWNDMFEGYDREGFLKRSEQLEQEARDQRAARLLAEAAAEEEREREREARREEERRRDADAEKAGVSSPVVGETQSGS